MIRSELVRHLAEQNPTLGPRDVERLVAVVFEAIAERLAIGGRGTLRGVGAVTTPPRAARPGGNPRTGDAVLVDAKRVPYFKPGKEMRSRLNV